MAYQSPRHIAQRTLFLTYRVRAEKQYKRLLKVMMKKLQRVIAGVTNYGQMPAALANYAATREFNRFCEQTARQIVTMLAVGQQQSWRAAASASSSGRRIFLALQRELKTKAIGGQIKNIINSNAQLIKAVPHNLAERFSRMAMESQYAGKRPEELLEIYKQMAPHLTDVEARRIARTESAKAATALVEARANAFGLGLYIWDTVDDQRVRDSHKLMEGVICAWDDPPNPEALAGEKTTYGSYHPAGIFNCRCVPLTIVDLQDIKFPARVHNHGVIVRVNNLNELKGIFGKITARYETA